MKTFGAALATAMVLNYDLGTAAGQTSNPPEHAIEHVDPQRPGASNPAQLPPLTAGQKRVIFKWLAPDKSKIRWAENFRAAVGAHVPRSIELWPLPEGALAEAP